jgi:hypothetical protein|mmetsp:Transcript_18535/g.38196  ORF Transcript_18535/g.38196 Transcript_18535/m.38196 type:complete len:368 (+) Transcript_18535:39-1142(+)
MAPNAALHQNLLRDLQEDNYFFDQLVDMVPAKLYIAGQSGDDWNPKYFKGQAKESKEARRAKNKQSKRAKFDPSKTETTTQAKMRLEGRVTMVKPVAPKAVTPTSDKKSRIEALRERLHAKLAEKRGNRPSDPNAVSKRAARRAEKKKRQEEAIRRNKKKNTSNAESKNNNKRLKMSNSAQDASTDLAQLDFGRLAGLNSVGTNNYTEVNKALKNLSKSKNLEKMLADAESKKQRLEELKKSNRPEDKQKALNMEWGDALKEATGERVKDDPTKLKKVLKRKAAKKLKSQKAWKTRMETTQQKMDDRQKIRNHNLSRRKMGGSAGANLSSKRIDATSEEKTDEKKRKRLGRAGFEGKKQGFLNKKEQ